MKDADSALISW